MTAAHLHGIESIRSWHRFKGICFLELRSKNRLHSKEFGNIFFNILLQMFNMFKVRRLRRPRQNLPFFPNLILCQCTGVFGVIILLEYPFKWHISLWVWKHSFVHYLYINSFVHNSFYLKYRTSSTVWKTSPYLNFCTTMLNSFFVYCSLYSVLDGGRT